MTLSDKQNHLFISYAVEDIALAEWLSLKLITEGYKVWCDKIKLLGGEPFPSNIDDAIKNKSFRVLALISRNSIDKPNPRKERTIAQNLSTKLNIDDFLIPLNADGLSPTELDWMTSDLTFISFDKSWADGFAMLLKKLEAINAPKLFLNGHQTICDWFSSQEKPIKRNERIWTNLIPILQIPNVIHQFEITQEFNFNRINSEWVFYKQNSNTFWSFLEPDSHFNLNYKKNVSVQWKDSKTYKNIDLKKIVAYLIKRCIALHCFKNGMRFIQKRKNELFFPKGLFNNDNLNFITYEGKKSHIKVANERVFYRSGEREMFRYHLSPVFYTNIRELDNPYVRITIRLYLTDIKGVPLDSKKVISRRKSICKDWWNEKWLHRVLAVSYWLANGEKLYNLISTPDGDLIIKGKPLFLNSSFGIDEDRLNEEEIPQFGPIMSDDYEDDIMDIDEEEEDEEIN